MTKFTLQESQKKINDVKSFYDALSRHGFYLPSIKSGLVTIAYLKAVRAGNIWVPLTNDVRLKFCKPPKKELILSAIITC